MNFANRFKIRLDLVCCYYSSNNGAIGALRIYTKENKLKEDTSNRIRIMKLMQTFEKTYFLQDLLKSGRKLLACDLMPAIKEGIDKSIYFDL